MNPEQPQSPVIPDGLPTGAASARSVNSGNPITNWVSSGLRKLLGGVRNQHLLHGQEFDEAEARIRPAAKTADKLILVIAALITIAGTACIRLVRTFLDPAPVNPVLDTVTGTSWVGGLATSLCCGLFVGVASEPLLTALLCRQPWALFRRYYASKTGWLPGRKIASFLFVPLIVAPFMAFFALRDGEVVDDRGLRFTTGFFDVHRQTYADVAAIEVYSSFRAPAGVQHRPALRVTFSGGVVWDRNSDDNARSQAQVMHLAGVISQRSGVPVLRGGLRP